MPPRVAFVRSKSPAGLEPRIRKEAGTLARAGYDVHAILWDRECEYPEEEEREGIRIHRFPLRAPEGKPDLALLLPRWWSFLFFRLLALQPNVVHAVDFDTVVPALAAARLAGARLAYDIFDFYAEMITAPLSPRFRALLANWERRMIERADVVILPDLRRKEQFGRSSPRSVVEILNVPEDHGPAGRADETGPFWIFYGGMISKDRGLIDLLAACEATGARLLVAGHGPDEAELVDELESSPAASFLGTVSYEEILRQTANAHAIAALYDPSVPNNRYAAPNKLFEAMMLSKPVLVSEGTLPATIVREEGCGIIVTYGDREALKRALESLMLSPEASAEMGRRGRAAFERRYNWSAMEPVLLETYDGLLQGRGNSAQGGVRS